MSELGRYVTGFPGALGGLLATPGRALGRIEAAERGGVSAALIWCLLAGLALRFPALARAVAGVEAGGGLQIIGSLTNELTLAVPAALAAALCIVVVAGDRRDPGLDLELGAAAIVPLLVVRAFVRAGAAGAAGADLLCRRGPVDAGLGGPGGAHRPAEAGGAPSRADPGGAAPGARSGLERDRRAGAGAGDGRGLDGAERSVARAAGAGDARAGLPASADRRAGGAIALGDLRGQVVLLDFWATWCSPCLAMLPMLHQLHAELAPRGVAFLGINSDGDQATRAEVESFVRRHGAPYPVLHDDGTANGRYRVNVLPTLVVVGRDGTIHKVMVGMTSKRSLRDAITGALAP
jgi:thiol-disulfide isomerase/thioredoxin